MPLCLNNEKVLSEIVVAGQWSKEQQKSQSPIKQDSNVQPL